MSHDGHLQPGEAPRQPPLEVARDTFLLRYLTPSVGGTLTNLNAMLIRGAEPMVVDTGMVTDREAFFADVFALVPPEELRWIFVTHNDSDHSGNMVELLERCPNAKIITSNGESFRTARSFGVPYERLRMADNGADFDLGDRVLRAIRPPVYDSPYTRGLWDPTTGVYYASDAFCAPMPDGPVDWVEEIAQGAWAESFASFHHASLCPWVALVDRAAFRAEVDRIAALEITTLLSAHAPAMRGETVRKALHEMARLPESASPA